MAVTNLCCSRRNSSTIKMPSKLNLGPASFACSQATAGGSQPAGVERLDRSWASRV